LFTKLSDIIPKYFKKHNLTTVGKAAQVVDFFPKVIAKIFDESLNEQVKAVSLEDSFLNLQASSNTVAQEIQLSKLQIIEKLNEHFKEERVKDLRFRIKSQHP